MIEFKNVTKTFYNKKKFKKEKGFCLKNISFKINDGETVGIIGKNGSGKSTLIRLLTGLLNPDEGLITIDNLNIIDNEVEYKRKLGVLFGGDVSLYEGFTAFDNIKYFGQLNGVEDSLILQRIQTMANYFEMNDYLYKNVDSFSRGMKQKTSFVRSIIHEPQNIILDEPSTGLDIQAIKEVWNFVKYNQKINKTILISSHNMEEIKVLCSKLIILKNGEIVFFGNTKDVFKSDGDKLLNKFLGVKDEYIQENL